MIEARRIEQCTVRAGSAEWEWLLLCLLAAVAILLSLAQPMPAHAQGSDPYYVTNSGDTDPDCDQSHGLANGHCHATVTCAAYGQLEANIVGYGNLTNGHPLPIAQDVCISQTLRPNLQPPKHSSQA